MKKMFSLLIALLLIALPALAEPMSNLDYTDDLLPDGSPIYYFPELSLTLPADWNGKVMAVAEEGRTAFYQRASYEKYQEEGIEGGGFLFALGACVDRSFSELPAFKYIGFSEQSAMNYFLELPSDYPAYTDDAIRAEYDAMHAQIDWVAEHAVIYAAAAEAIEAGDTGGDAAEAAGEAAEAEAAEVTHTLSEVRYYFEHNLLPRYFYEMPGDLLDVIRTHGLYVLWESFTTENGVDPTYPPEDFVEHCYTAADGATLLQVELPEPDDNTLCYRICFVYDAASGTAGYYTSESDTFTPDACFLCHWTPEGEHVNYGAVDVLDRTAADYGEALRAEAALFAGQAGVSTELTEE